MKKYKSIVSLGWFCSTAKEIKRIGLRECAFPFDWLLTHNFESVIDLIEANFDDFLLEDFLYQFENYPQYYRNIRYNIDFYHDFSQFKSLSKQISIVREKYERRIKRFYNTIQEPTLFIRYINSSSRSGDLEYIKANYEKISHILKQYNSANEIIYIMNDDVKIEQAIKVFYVKKDVNDNVSRVFLEQLPELEEWLRLNISSNTAVVTETKIEWMRKKIKRVVCKLAKKMGIYYRHGQKLSL